MLEYDIRCIQIIFFSVGLKAKKTKAVLNDEDEEADTPCRKRKNTPISSYQLWIRCFCPLEVRQTKVSWKEPPMH